MKPDPSDPIAGDSVEIRLDHPVEADETTLETLAMRRPRVADQLAAEKAGGADGAREVALFANLCEVAPEIIRRLALSDYLELQRVFSGFLSRRGRNSVGQSPS